MSEAHRSGWTRGPASHSESALFSALGGLFGTLVLAAAAPALAAVALEFSSFEYPLAFVERPIAAALGAGTILLWLSPLVTRFIRPRSA